MNNLTAQHIVDGRSDFDDMVEQICAETAKHWAEAADAMLLEYLKGDYHEPI